MIVFTKILIKYSVCSSRLTDKVNSILIIEITVNLNCLIVKTHQVGQLYGIILRLCYQCEATDLG